MNPAGSEGLRVLVAVSIAAELMLFFGAYRLGFADGRRHGVMEIAAFGSSGTITCDLPALQSKR